MRARMALIRAIAAAHGATLRRAVRQAARRAAPFSPDATSAGRRALRNACLRYLTAADDESRGGTGRRPLPHRPTNMTDMIAGLAALTRMDSPLRDAAFAHFHDRFRERSAGARQMDGPAGRVAPRPTRWSACAR